MPLQKRAKFDPIGVKRNTARDRFYSKNENSFEVIKRYPKPCSTITFILENRLNPFDSIPLATLRFELSEKDDFAKFLAE